MQAAARVAVRATRQALVEGAPPDRVILCAFDVEAERALRSALG